MKNLSLIWIACFLLSCNTEKPKEKEESANTLNTSIHLSALQLKNAGIESGYAEEKPVSSTLKVNGKIDVPPQNIISISVPLGGYLKSTHLLPGTPVKKGELLAIIEDPQYIQMQQDYLTALARLNYSEADYNRQKLLNESKASSDKVFQQTEVGFKTESILVKSLNEKLKLIGIDPASLNESTLSRTIRITSPIDGYVTAVNANIGKYIHPSDVLFELINPTDIHLNLKVFEKDLDKIAIGQKLHTYSNAHPEKTYPCEIILISQNFSPDRSVEVHCHFRNYDKSLIPGMYMTADIYTNPTQALVVPESAVVSFEGKEYIFLDSGQGNFEWMEVITTASQNGLLAINLSKNVRKKIVLKGAYKILMAMKNKTE